MVEPAPGRLSMTTGCPNASDSHAPNARPVGSVEPPGGYGTISRMGRDGYVSCASTGTANAHAVNRMASANDSGRIIALLLLLRLIVDTRMFVAILACPR